MKIFSRWMPLIATMEAMFTSVPTSFAAFGFSSGWDKFEIYPPNTGKPATGPFDDGAAWLSAAHDEEKPERPMLALLHARVMLEAQRDLSYTTLSVKQIALGLGFSDAGYFTRFFQRLSGRTPTQWRGAAHAAGA